MEIIKFTSRVVLVELLTGYKATPQCGIAKPRTGLQGGLEAMAALHREGLKQLPALYKEG